VTSSTLSTASRPRPRVEGHPEYAHTKGDLAIDLARRAGLILDPWQQDALRIMMSCRADGKWACRQYCEWVPRQNGKGALLEARVLAGFLLLDEQLIMWSAHQFKTVNRAFRRMRKLIRALGRRVKPDDDTLYDIPGRGGKTIRIKITRGNNEKGFERLDTEAQVVFIARSKDSARGFDGDLNIIDESYAFTAEEQDALQPTMRAKPNPQIIYTSTPPLNGDSGEVMFALRARAEAGDFTRLGYRDWGLAGDLDHLDKIDLDDRANWVATNPAHGIRIDDEDIEEDRRAMSSRGGLGFARECLGVWPQPRNVAGGKIVEKDWREKILDPKSRRDLSAGLALGVDLSVEGDYAAIFLYSHQVDGLGHGRLVDYVAGTDWIVPRLKVLDELFEPITIAMGKNTYTFLKAKLADAGFKLPADPKNPRKGDLAVMVGADQSAACVGIIQATRKHTMRVRPDEDDPEILNEAVKGSKTRRAGDTIAWARADEVDNDDAETSPLGAMTAARWGYYERLGAAARDHKPATAPTAPPSRDVREIFRPVERLNI
jgi:hypothetical protein